MAKAENEKNPEERMAALEAEVKELKKRGGGMLSSYDFRERVIFKKDPEDEQYAKIEVMFQKRDWGPAKEEIRKYKGNRGVEPRKCFIVEPFDLLNLTPFSYDLSIGDEIFSIRKKDRMRKHLPYFVEPGETVIVLTREFISLPPCYSATVWPRFNLVRGGIFQSMVKIDPTWYGKLGVAMNNLSPRTIELKEDMAFGTLVLYELASETDIDLRQPRTLPSVRVDIPDIPIRVHLQQELEKLKLTNVCWVEGNQLVVRGLKKSSYKKLCSVDSSKPWQETAEKAKEAWVRYEDPDTKRRSIGMEALKMENLEKLVEGPPMGDPVDADTVKTADITPDKLYEVAVEYGKPFDSVAAIPEFIIDKMRHEITPRIQAEVEANVFPKIVTLTLTVLGFLSLIIAVAAFVIEKYRPSSPAFLNIEWSLTATVVVVILGAVLLWAIYRVTRLKTDESRALQRLQKKVEVLEKDKRSALAKDD